MLRSWALAAMLSVVALAGCRGDDGIEPVSDADAREFLNVAVGLAQEGKVDRLCSEMRAPQSTCRIHLDQTGASSAPAQAPVVIESAALPPSDDNPSPGRLLTVCGVDGIGRKYQTGFLVYRERSGLVAPYPIFWSGVGVVTQLSPSRTTPREPTDPLSRCSEAGAFAAVGATLAEGPLADQRSAPAAPDVFVSGGGPPFRGAPAAALALAAARSGLAIPPLKNDNYELWAISLQDDVDGVRLPVQTAQLIYERRGAEPGKGRLTVYHTNGRQRAISAGRQAEPDPVRVPNNAGLEIVRVDLGESVGFTVWRSNTTHDIVFAPPALSDAEMLAVVESLFR